MTRAQLFLWVAGIYLVSVVGIMAKVSSQLGGLVIANIYQLLALLVLPIAWGALPILLAVGYLIYLRFDLARAKMGLIYLAMAYGMFVMFKLVSSQKI